MKRHILYYTALVCVVASSYAWAACPYGTDPDQTTGICTRSGCDGYCTYYVTLAPGENPNNEYDITVKPNQGVQGDVILGGYWDSNAFLKVRNFTVGEGITGSNGYMIINNGSGTLKLPSTLKNMNGWSTYNIGFQTIDLSDVKNLETSGGGPDAVPNTIALNGVYNLHNLIVSEDTSPISIGYAYSTDNYPNREVKIECKGTDPDKCQNLLRNAAFIQSRSENFSVSPAYYQGYDEKGHLIEAWGPNGCTKYSYDAGGNLQRQTDANGNVLWARRIYSVDEAVKAVGKQNTFSIRYR